VHVHVLYVRGYTYSFVPLSARSTGELCEPHYTGVVGGTPRICATQNPGRWRPNYKALCVVPPVGARSTYTEFNKKWHPILRSAHTHLRAYVPAYVHICAHTYIYTRKCIVLICLRMHIYVHARIYVHVSTLHMYMHVCTYIYAHAKRIRTYVYIYTHICIYICAYLSTYAYMHICMCVYGYVWYVCAVWCMCGL